ncbi:hypothetical protein HPB48_021071 [Haemaphysalis longicornis]|uniref:Uncharacterized protein n=1 Tax=Haemaphysalis longicornis TaxID=44386 RepID=A0A9J6GTX4_HAELO|nr:hypothetical protein HPB48_021071 [Haemaphysalis longicornis]
MGDAQGGVRIFFFITFHFRKTIKTDETADEDETTCGQSSYVRISQPDLLCRPPCARTDEAAGAESKAKHFSGLGPNVQNRVVLPARFFVCVFRGVDAIVPWDSHIHHVVLGREIQYDVRPMSDSLLICNDLSRGDCGFRMDDFQFFDNGLLDEIMTNNPGSVYGRAFLQIMEGSLFVGATTSAQPCLGVPGSPVGEVAGGVRVVPQSEGLLSPSPMKRA